MKGVLGPNVGPQHIICTHIGHTFIQPPSHFLTPMNLKNVSLNRSDPHKMPILPGHSSTPTRTHIRGGGVLRKYLYGDAQSRLQNVDHLYTCVLKKKTNKQTKQNKKQKKTPDHYTSSMTKPTHLYTIFTEMMTHYYHFHQQNSPSSYHHRNKGSLIYLEQLQNHL